MSRKFPPVLKEISWLCGADYVLQRYLSTPVITTYHYVISKQYSTNCWHWSTQELQSRHEARSSASETIETFNVMYWNFVGVSNTRRALTNFLLVFRTYTLAKFVVAKLCAKDKRDHNFTTNYLLLWCSCIFRSPYDLTGVWNILLQRCMAWKCPLSTDSDISVDIADCTTPSHKSYDS